MQLSKNIRRALKAILFVVILFVLMIILDASFELDEAATEKMLTKYSKQADIDTIFVGNSAGEMLDAPYYSELAGCSAFNMCTPSQGLSVSLKNIKLARSHHRIKRVVLLMTPDIVNSDDYAGIDHLYDRVVNSSSPFYIRVKNTIAQNMAEAFSPKVVNTERSINLIMPWQNETLHGFSNIRNNLKKRFSRFVSGRPLGCDIAFDLNTVIYENKPGDLTDEDIELINEDSENISSLGLPAGMISPDKILLLGRICTYCRDNGIDFKVIVTPHRSDYYDRFESFRQHSEELSAFLNDLVSKRGFMYYNTEDDPELHVKLPDKYFYDWEHISQEYDDIATEYLYDVITTKMKN